jgi:rhamnopyranosyl-N-acetylglucosaminyl-diphospho-decaprenol beta-1,3/1,4-galactofuranosyltransferase
VPREPFVVAVVVTFRRTELLRRCVEAIRAQTRPPDLTIVVDNGDEAAAALSASDALEIVRTGSNLGPAGGYDRGLRLAMERGADRIWTVDDDVEPDPNCLALLLADPGEAGVVLPLQERPGGERSAPPAWTGALIDAKVVRAIGYPRTELFFWAEDTEYFHRARMAGFGRRRVEDARVLHHTADRVRGSERTWRLYYEVRNTVHIRLGYRGPAWRRLPKLLPVVFGKPLAIVAYEPRKIRGLRMWWRGLRDGVSGRLGRVIDPAGDPPRRRVTVRTKTEPVPARGGGSPGPR